MDIGIHTFERFKTMVAEFHGYAAPGVLIGGYMVEKAKTAIPRDTLFEVIVESKKCLPDAVQMLTPCSAGNNWMKVIHLGRYALSMYDKHTGVGVRAFLDAKSLDKWPEIRGWFMKEKPKAEQNPEELLREIEWAGDSICGIQRMRVHEDMLKHKHMGAVVLCPSCGEAYPAGDGTPCRGCRGEAPYDLLKS